jgi:hypothetical protein
MRESAWITFRFVNEKMISTAPPTTDKISPPLTTTEKISALATESVRNEHPH